SGNVVFFNAVQNELMKYKNGEFTILYSSKTTKESDPSLFGSILQMKKQRNGRYSYFTNLHSGSKNVFELVLFEADGSILEKYTVPSLDDRYKNAQVEFLDYLFDSKGSLFFLTSSQGELFKDSNGSFRDTLFFAGIVEVTSNKQIRYYNDNIGIQPSWYKSESFDIDDDDNIWFMYNYRRDNKMSTIYPSLYKLESNRTNVVEYTFETWLENSRIFNGEVPNYNYELNYEHKTIKYNSFRGSLFISNSRPLIEFYPKGIPPTSVREIATEKALVYPHPIPEGKNAQLETQTLLGIKNGVKVVIQDLRGSLIKEYMYYLDSENYSISLNTEGLIRGSYVVSIFSNSNRLLLQTNFIKE
ncbi:MAG: hypothetical protein MUE72_13810, partial [Chitinophagaceae bacterium]|nr:hypothetical protein [Chitinophagaceae bacterium]